MKAKSILNTLVVLAMLAGLAIGVTVSTAQGTPPFTVHVDDCDGSAIQSDVPEPNNGCQTYNGDVYENIVYGEGASTPPQCNDIDSFHMGADDEYLYFEWTFVGPYISGCTSVNLVLEIDADGSPTDNGGLRGDYYITTNLAAESDKCGSTTWREISVAGWDAYRDGNDNVGGSNPATGFGASGSDYDYGGGGYETARKRTGYIYCRSVTSDYQSTTNSPDYANQPGFQLAVKRGFFTKPALGAQMRARAWTSQSSSLSNDKLYWHDENSSDKLAEGDTDIDNTEWGALAFDGYIADRVWLDGSENGDQNQHEGTDEPGFDGVDIYLYDYQPSICGEDGHLAMTTTVTGTSQTPDGWPDGIYGFDMDALGLGTGTYWICVDESTLPASQYGWDSTTGSNPQQVSYKTGVNDFSIDFGYKLAGPPTAVTLFSFAVNSGAGGSVNPLWLGLAGLTMLAAGSLFWVKRRAD